jgi:hypothetical protein
VSLLVASCSYEAARHAVEHWHYSRRLPGGPFVRYGVWEHGQFIGAVLFGRGANPNLLTPYGLDLTEGAELVRVALCAHEAPVSQIVSRAVRLLRDDSPGLRLLVSFADPARGHHGGIYQAMNWIYAGRTQPAWAFIDDREQVRHRRATSATGWISQHGRLSRGLRRDECERVRLPGKHRYLLPLDRGMARRVAPLSRPYPLRAP